MSNIVAVRTEEELAQFFNILHTVARDKLFRFCYARVQNYETAEDVVQESFSRIWCVMLERGEEIRPNAIAYLYRIAQNLIVSRARRTKTEFPLDNVQNMATEDIDLYRDEAVRTAFRSLRSCEKNILLLHDIHDIDTNNIAHRLGKNKETMRVALHRARKALRKKLSGQSAA